MPAVCCPICEQPIRVPAEQLGQKVECSRCLGWFEAVVEPDSWTRYLHRRHVAGLRVGVGLLAAAAIAALIVAFVIPKYPTLHDAIFGHEAPVVTRYVFWIGIAALCGGVFLIVRWSRAQRHWRPR